MRIAICDDNINELNKTKTLVQDYYFEKNISCDIICYNDPNDLLIQLNFNIGTTFDLYFLDVIMQINGIDVAKKIKQIHPEAVIIFTTTSDEFAVDAFGVRAYHYLLKPINIDLLYKCLDDFEENINNKVNKTFSFKTANTSIVNVEINKIAYIESIDRRIVIHLINKDLITGLSLRTKFLDSIPFDYEKHNFISCHSAFIVNMNHIKELKSTFFVLSNDDYVPISSRSYQKVKKTYINYLIGE